MPVVLGVWVFAGWVCVVGDFLFSVFVVITWLVLVCYLYIVCSICFVVFRLGVFAFVG